MKIDRIVISTFIIISFLSSTPVWSQNSSSSLPSNTSIAPAPAAAKEAPAKYTGAVTVTTLGRSFQDEYVKSTVGWSFVEFGVNSIYTDWLSFNFNLLGYFGEGAAQNYLTDEGAGQNGIIINSIGLELKPISQMTLKAGIINYRINPILTTMTPGTSLGSEQKLEVSNGPETVKLTLIGNEAIPSSGVTKGMVQEGKDPFFLAGTVQGDLKLNPIKTTLKIAATQFKFGNLPKSAASGALTGGNSINSVTGIGDQMQFAIGFAGIETAASLETEWTSKLTSNLKAAAIENQRGFEDTNKGYIGSFGLKWKSGNVTFSPTYMLIDVQADTTPAGYSILVNRFNNRKGQRASLNVFFEKQKLGFIADYTNLEEIQQSPFLTDREIYNLGVEVNYDLF